MSEGQTYWFKPKTHGYGAAPIHWKGWALIGAFVLYVLAVTQVLVVGPTLLPDGLSVMKLGLWLAAMALGILLFVHLTKKKTDGPWRWRWGKK